MGKILKTTVEIKSLVHIDGDEWLATAVIRSKYVDQTTTLEPYVVRLHRYASGRFYLDEDWMVTDTPQVVNDYFAGLVCKAVQEQYDPDMADREAWMQQVAEKLHKHTQSMANLGYLFYDLQDLLWTYNKMVPVEKQVDPIYVKERGV